MKIAITAESTIDLPKELLDKFDIKTVPFHVLLGEDEYRDGEIAPSKIYDYVKASKVLPKTSAVNESAYQEFFDDVLKDNDAIIHFSLSSELSSACQNAKNVASRMSKVYVVDTKTLSTGIALLAIYARDLINQGYDVVSVFNKVLSAVPNVQVSFVLDRLDYMYKGGRCSALQLFGANLLRLKPQIDLNNGKMVAGKKYMGKIDSVAVSYVKNVLKNNPNPILDNVFITHSGMTNEVLINKIREMLLERGFKNVYVTTAGCTICSHCGDNCIGVLFRN